MKKVSAVVLVLCLVSLTVGQRIPLNYFFDALNGLPPKTLTNPAWGQDTSVLRHILDSNAYSGSCLPYIQGFASNNPPPLNNYTVYRISFVRIAHQSWLKKITADIGKLLYLEELDVFSCPNFNSLNGINQYLIDLEIDSCPISTFNCDFRYIKMIYIGHCKNLTSFSYNIPQIKSLTISCCGLSDISAINIGDSLKGTIRLDSNELTTLPLYFLQKLQLNGAKINIDYNKLSNVSAAIATILDSISVDKNWRSTQRPSTSIKPIFNSYKIHVNFNSDIYKYNILGKRLIKNNDFNGVLIDKQSRLKIIIK